MQRFLVISLLILNNQREKINIESKLGNTPLIIAVENNNINTIKELIENKENVNAKNNYGYTALKYASKYGNIEIVKYLISKGADVNISNNKKITPLMEAVVNGHKYTMEILIANGADVNLKDFEGNTALNYARLFRVKNKIISASNNIIFNNTKVEYMLIDNLHDDIVKILFDAGAKEDNQDKIN